MRPSNIVFWIAVIVSLVFFHTRGFISHDEGWTLAAAGRILDGQVPYRDFYFLYTPGSIFATAFIFKFFGESILTARILAMIFSLVSSVYIYKITKQISNHAAIQTFSTILFLLWGPFQTNFVWMVMLSIASGLATVYYLEKSYFNSNFSFFAGLAAGLTLLFKQNFGFAILITVIIALVFNSNLRTKTKILNLISGCILTIGLFVIYLLWNNSLFIFFGQMYYLTVQKIIIEGMLSSPFIYPDVLYKQAIKLAFYASPLISLFSIYLLRKRKNLIFMASFPLLYYFVSIRPTTDLIHLAPLISILGINFAFIYKYSKDKIIQILTILVLILFVLLGVYVVIFRGYYRWESPILSHNIFYNHPKINIFVDQKFEEVLNVVIPELDKSKSEYIFVYHFAPMFYFVSDKKNPTYYDDLQPKLLTPAEQEKIVANLQEKKVDTILTNSNL